MSVFVTLKDYLTDKIEALSSVQKVYGYEPEKLSGWPAVTVTLPTMEGEFSSNAEDSRVYGFTVRVYFPLGQDIETPKTMPREQYAENVIATVLEDIANTIDTDFDLTDVTQSSNITVKFTEATDIRPIYIEMDGGWIRGAEISIRIYTEKTVV